MMSDPFEQIDKNLARSNELQQQNGELLEVLAVKLANLAANREKADHKHEETAKLLNILAESMDKLTNKIDLLNDKIKTSLTNNPVKLPNNQKL